MMKMRYGFTVGSLGVLFLLLLFTSAMAGSYNMGGGAWQTPRMEQSRLMPAPSAAFTGTLAAFNEQESSILVDTFVPGLLGPSERLVPFNIADDTTMTICVKSTNTCDSALTGADGLDRLASLEKLDTFAGVKKNVVVVGDPEESSRVVHVQIEYQL